MAGVPSPRPLTDECVEFLLGVMGFHLDEVETLWVFSDWAHMPPRDFAKRLEDLCLSRVARRDP